MIFSSIDIGTNTIRIQIAKKIGSCAFEFLYKESRIARLGQGLLKNGCLSRESIKRAIDILKSYAELSKKYKADRIFACATSAVREAKNSNEFLKEAKKIGINISVIDSDKEAYLTHKGIIYFLKDTLKNLNWTAFDLGGGSTEFIFSKGIELTRTFSIPLGVVKLLEKFVKHNPPNKEELENAVSLFIDSLNIYKPERNIDVLVANAGTVTSLAAIDLGLENYSYYKTEGYRLSLQSVNKILDRMARLNSEQRLKEFRILEKGREDVIVVGAYLVKELMVYFGKSYIITTNGSLREGILVDELCGKEY